MTRPHPHKANRRRRAWGPRIGVLAILLSAHWASTAAADERILSFHADIMIMQDASLVVTETIRARAEGKQIKRGLYREFPTTYQDRFGKRFRVRFDVIDVRRDGKQEPYHIKRLSNGERVYIGREAVLLQAGEYTYTLVYKTDRQIGYYPEFDELYWNVTGNGWAFPIDKASATVTLPATIAARELHVEGYTGPRGSKAADLSAAVTPAGRAVFETRRPLRPREGLTIVVNWPKGHVRQPTREEQLALFVRDNRSAGVAAAGFAVTLVILLVSWVMVGRDPAKATIIPRFFPPKGISPAAARFIWRMGYDHKCFAAAVLNLAVKGGLTILQNGTFSVQRKHAKPDGLGSAEQKLFTRLFAGSDALTFTPTSHTRVQGAVKTLKTALKTDFEKDYFARNTMIWAMAILPTVLTWIGVVAFSSEPAAAGFLTVWLSFWSVGVFALLGQVFRLWANAIRGINRISSLLGGAFMSVFALPFVGGEIFVIIQ